MQRNTPCTLPTRRRSCAIIGRVRQQPRQIYTSVRSSDRVPGATPTLVRTVVVALLGVLALAVILIVMLSLV